MNVMRAKFVVSNVETNADGTAETLHFSAVAKSTAYDENGSDDDNSYARWTPSAECKMHVNNPALLGKFKPGQKFYVDFSSADA